ncbi:MAG: cysteine--tRNA ligase [Pseudomonadota bacterium]
MTLHIHNTLTRQKEAFEPIDSDHVRLYVCGPTVYDRAHIGNARPVVVFDTLDRLLRARYPKVTYARNITDVDDKIIDAAAQNGEAISDLTKRTEQAYLDDMDALYNARPTIQPRATEHIDEMIDLISQLVKLENAYEAEGHVLFHVPSMEKYGKLSNRSRDEMIAGARVEVAPYKRDPGDFVLWKPTTDEQPGWDSPWGRGRPGWHIECSAMARRHLGKTFDIHGGGADLIFPHHENEIAQSCCAFGTDFMAKYWMHNGYLVVEGEKMSKSLGNFITVRELLDEGHSGEAIRLTLLSAQYRQALDFNREGLKQSQSSLDRFYRALRDAATELEVESFDAAAAPDALMAALEDDLNTPLALSVMHEIATELNKAKPAEKAALAGALLGGGAMLGILNEDPDTWLKRGTGDSGGPSAEEIESLIEARITARGQKDFAEADRIRDALKAQGIILEDKPGGTIWRRES